MSVTLPNKNKELKVDDVTFSTIVEEINEAASNLRPTGNNGGLENFMRHIEHIVKSHGISYSDYCSDVMIRRS